MSTRFPAPVRKPRGSFCTCPATSWTRPKLWPGRPACPRFRSIASGCWLRPSRWNGSRTTWPRSRPRRGPLEGFNEISGDPGYLSEWRELSGARQTAASGPQDTLDHEPEAAAGSDHLCRRDRPLDASSTSGTARRRRAPQPNALMSSETKAAKTFRLPKPTSKTPPPRARGFASSPPGVPPSPSSLRKSHLKCWTQVPGRR